jgi:hypothetical protein
MAGDKNLDDILASIRKIVVEDPTAKAQAPEPDIDDALLDPDFDTLPLTELVNEPDALPTEAGIQAADGARVKGRRRAGLRPAPANLRRVSQSPPVSLGRDKHMGAEASPGPPEALQCNPRASQHNICYGDAQGVLHGHQSRCFAEQVEN